MTSTDRILCVVLLLGFAGCDSSSSAGSGGAGGDGTGGAGGRATGGSGDGGGLGGVGGHAGAGDSGSGKATGGAGGGHGGGGGNAGGAGGRGTGGGGAGGNADGGAGGAHAGAGGGSGGGAQGGAGGTACAFSATYNITDGGGTPALLPRTTLSPPDMFHFHQLKAQNGPTQDCTPALPSCGSTAIDVSDIEAALANPDVQTALGAADSPSYGDRSLIGAPAFALSRSTGGGFSAGPECNVASTTCTPTPTGIRTLVGLLRDLITQQTADPSCAAR